MIYQGIRDIIKIALAVFFKKIVVTGKENIPASGPLILVANHPNTFMDPMIIASIIEQRIGFVAKSGIFVNKFIAAIFRYFHVIPIFRKTDLTPGEQPDNKEAFEKCHDYLNSNGTLLIFPEGSSFYELKLRDIKTGTARIALSFDKHRNFGSNLKILPVALDYSDSIQFRSMVSVTLSTPIPVARYKEMYLQHEFEAIKALTEDIRKELAENIPQTAEKNQELFLIKAHKFYAAYYEPGADLYENPKRSLELRKGLSKAMHHINSHNNQLYNNIQSKIIEYFDELKSENITVGFLSEQFLERNKILVLSNYLLKFILLFPIYIIGLITNYLPYIIPAKIFSALRISLPFKAPVQMVSGLLTFPLFYAIAIWLFRYFITSELWSTLLFIIFLPVSGYITIYYWTELRRFKRVVHFYFFMDFTKKRKLLDLRNEILDKMEEARRDLPESITVPGEFRKK